MGEHEQTTDRIGGDRRRSRRYPINLDLRYKVTRGRRLVEMGSGQTLDMSSDGVAFSTGHVLPVGMVAELTVEWPYSLNGYPLRLVVKGRIVRSSHTGTALRNTKHEFRLAGTRQLAALAREAMAYNEAREMR